MGDLKVPWYGDKNPPPVPTPDLGGDLITARGGDPNTPVTGTSPIQAPWTDPFVGQMPGKETPNSVSGLPLHPDRYEPNDTPPPPPSVKDRNPGTIDEK